MSEETLENALQSLDITCKITEYRINKLTQMVEAIENTLLSNGEGYVKEVLKAFEEIKEEIQSLKVREDEVAKLLEDNLIIIGKFLCHWMVPKRRIKLKSLRFSFE
ncbi:uncharacterized protein isoform X2 [Rhodnius prolixus]|uniref:uncharacterized protein isoform X2 n=1 Tax=Rhodnius prolixus TaxID=13249 RepID=UPI003D18B087